MLLDPFEEQFDLPAALIQLGDGQSLIGNFLNELSWFRINWHFPIIASSAKSSLWTNSTSCTIPLTLIPTKSQSDPSFSSSVITSLSAKLDWLITNAPKPPKAPRARNAAY